jgi:hypothetical protein
MIDMLVMGGKFQRDTFDKKSKPSNDPRQSGYTLIEGADKYFNENNQKQNNANVGNRPEWVGWSLQ